MNTLDDELKPLTKTEAARFVESVSGVIISDYTVNARLYSKKTRRQVSASGALENDQAARDWANAWVEEQKKIQGAEFQRLYGTDGFELRVWD